MRMILFDGFVARFNGDIIEISPKYDTYMEENQSLKSVHDEFTQFEEEKRALEHGLNALKAIQ